MEDLFAYSKYKQVLCIVFNEEERLAIYRSSSRATEITDLPVLLLDDTMQNQSSKSLLKDYLDACIKDKDHQTKQDKHAMLIVQQKAKQLRRDLLRDDNNVVFDECQFIFILPLGWNCDEYMNQLRALFIETEWIRQSDSKNRLIFSPYIECLCQGLVANSVTNLARESKYLFLRIDKTAIQVLCFQMQNAKELAAVSKKLAASDFLLVPTEMGDIVSMDITELDCLIFNSAKKIIVRHIKSIIQRKRFYKKGGFKYYKHGSKKTAQRQHNNFNAAAQPLFSITSLHQVIEIIVSGLYEASPVNKSKPLYKTLYSAEEFKDLLKGLTCGAFMHDLLTDANVKEVVDQVVCRVKEIYSKYSKSQNSPDGIQNAILQYIYHSNVFYRDIFRVALLDAKVIDAQNEFIYVCEKEHICLGAMQKPFKMTQIANALLPPTIWNNGSRQQAELVNYKSCEDDLLPPNSFYVQACINDDHIRFILNKVVAVSSTHGHIQKSTFTIQEVSVELECIFESVCNNIWNHLMMLDYEKESSQHDHHCSIHLKGEYSVTNYHVFKCLIRKMTDRLLQNKSVKWDEEIDINRAIPISKECNCSFQISFRTLLNIGLQPAISQTATIIASSLASNSFFGLYTVSALIILDVSSQEMAFQDPDDTFKKTIQSCLETHYRKPVVFYDKEAVMNCGSLGNWCTSVQQLFGKGLYSQISSTEFIFKFSGTPINSDADEKFEMFKYYSNSLQKGDFSERPNEFLIPEKAHALDPCGSIYAFYHKDYSFSVIEFDMYIIDRHKGKAYYHGLWSRGFSVYAEGHPLTIRVTPRHHLSTIEFEVSHVRHDDIVDMFSFSILENLVLSSRHPPYQACS